MLSHSLLSSLPGSTRTHTKDTIYVPYVPLNNPKVDIILLFATVRHNSRFRQPLAQTTEDRKGAGDHSKPFSNFSKFSQISFLITLSPPSLSLALFVYDRLVFVRFFAGNRKMRKSIRATESIVLWADMDIQYFCLTPNVS